jgi:DNA-binding PadR family transcriptional regulator
MERLRERGIDKNIRALRPILRSLMMARAITAELVEGNGRVYSITDAGRAQARRLPFAPRRAQDQGGWTERATCPACSPCKNAAPR